MNSNSKVNIEYEPKRVYLLIGLFAGVILMLVVRVDLGVGAQRKPGTGVQCCTAPLPVLAVVVELCASIGYWTKRVTGQCPLNR